MDIRDKRVDHSNAQTTERNSNVIRAPHHQKYLQTFAQDDEG